MNNEETEQEDVEALCKECGHAFKVFVDRLTHDGKAALGDQPDVACPVCGCSECRIGK